jgi:hypothetical protein
MRVSIPLVVLLIGGIALWAGCERSSDAADMYPGLVSGHAPGPSLVTDLGILEDPAKYKPASTLRGAGLSGDERTQIEAALQELKTAAINRDYGAVLGMFNPAHVAVLKDRSELFAIKDTEDLLRRVLSEKLGDEAVAQLDALGKAAQAQTPSIEVHDNENATVKPNLVAPLLGPKATPAMAMKKIDNVWKIDLGSPLTDQDAEAIAAFHLKIQTAMDKLIQALEQDRITDLKQFIVAATQALQGIEPSETPPGGGEMPGGGEGAAPAPQSDAPIGDAEKPKEQPKPDVPPQPNP